MEHLINETNRLKEIYNEIPKNYDLTFLSSLKKSLNATHSLIAHPGVGDFLKDIDISINKKSIFLENTKKYINLESNRFIFSAFNASYFPDLGVEACFYEPLYVNSILQKKYVTNVRPVNIKMASKGFHSSPVVALFPENHIDKIQLNHDCIFYFINKFVERFFKITHKMLVTIVADYTFPRLISASYSEIEQACIYWVWLHEYHHRQGSLPIPKYLKIKSLKPLAGLEEMRVDICSILTCWEDLDLPREQAEFVSQFILAERLLRYAVEGISRPNYDAIASQLLFNFLQQNGGLIIYNMKIYLTNKLPSALKKLLRQINKIESGIEDKSEKEVQADLLKFTKSYTNFDQKGQDFHHINYFKQVKELLKL